MIDKLIDIFNPRAAAAAADDERPTSAKIKRLESGLMIGTGRQTT